MCRVFREPLSHHQTPNWDLAIYEFLAAILQRILRMNKWLEEEFGEHAEKRGWQWALTAFAVETWGKSKEKSKDLISVKK